VFVHLYHLNSTWCEPPPAGIAKLTSGARHHRALEIELALAQLELDPETFKQYWAYRRRFFQSDFFKRGRAALAQVKRRLGRLSQFWASRVLPKGISSSGEFSWPMPLRMLRYRAIKSALTSNPRASLLLH
jgi:hypothetical protein